MEFKNINSKIKVDLIFHVNIDIVCFSGFNERKGRIFLLILLVTVLNVAVIIHIMNMC